MKNLKVSIIIRTKNEERWIGHCLKAIFNQNYNNYEVIIVDNISDDGTLKKISSYNVKLVEIEKYTHGKALNLGIENSNGEILVIISGHCIPTNKEWLNNLVKEFNNDNIAGVYGRQMPMSFSSPQTKRDLLITFGLDKKIQIKDSFFHNANSAIKREVWEKNKFDETVTNIEDRVWASQVIKIGYNIIYTPDATVYHYHGIHHDNDINRVRRTAHVISSHDFLMEGSLNINNLHIVCIIPIKNTLLKKFGDKSFLDHTFNYVQKNTCINKTLLLTDSEEIADYAKSYNIETPFIRDTADSDQMVDLKMVYGKYYEKLEDALELKPDLILSIEPTYMFRSKDLIEKLIQCLLDGGYDTVLPINKHYNWVWSNNNGDLKRIDTDLPRHMKDPTIYGLKGLAVVTHPEYLRKGEILGQNVGMVEIEENIQALEIRSRTELNNMKSLLSKI